MRKAALPRRLLVVVLASLLALVAGHASGQGRDPAARGLDAFVHLPAAAAPGALLPVQIEVRGFPTIAETVPLGGATIEAAWDPEKLGKGVSGAPPAVRATADASGRAHLEVPVPEGDERELSLLIALRSGTHARTRAVKVQRSKPHVIAVHVGDTRVVPGGATSAWVLVTSAQSGVAVPNAPIEVSLLEGGVARFTTRKTTDLAGTAMVRVPIPHNEEPGWRWQLRARTLVADRPSGEATVTLTPREETPATPHLAASWQVDGLRAGQRGKWVARLRDASDRPVAGAALRFWVGPRGTEAPTDSAKWLKASTPGKTDALGELEGAADAPSVVAGAAGTTLTLVVRTTFEGRDLDATQTIPVGASAASAVLLPEGGAVVPGISQRVLLRVRDGKDEPVRGSFDLAGDGLTTTVTTDERGLAEIAWNAPAEVGARRDVGPCAGGVAAAVVVRPRGDVAGLGGRNRFELCVKVDRDAGGLITPASPLVRAGDELAFTVSAARGPGGRADSPRPGVWSTLLGGAGGSAAASAWSDADGKGKLVVPAGANGVVSLASAAPLTGERARLAGGAVLVAPRVLPRLAARVAGGRAAPGGKIFIDAELGDGKGTGLPGTVAAIVVDLRGGGSVSGLRRLDTRGALCVALDVEPALCDRFVDGDPALDGLRRGLLSAAMSAPPPPAADPGGESAALLEKTFAEMVRSLEGAVFESTGDADRLADARRRGPRGWVFNPELMTLASSAMEAPPLTPGGEPLALADLVAVDPQVSFDLVARRITRLKIFKVLASVRAFRREEKLDPEEPAMRDPNAIVRRLVRDGGLDAASLLDPWGGTLEFVKSNAATVPFLTAVRGWELRAPGPDGRLGSADDVKDPFERVLRSGTPYARAVEEDRLVDARFELEVGDPTVAAWGSLLERLTGTSLGGRGEGIGLGGIGTIGHGAGTGSGQGFGSGHGRLGGAISTGVAYWSPPVRTDARGRVRIEIPLGDLETTWRVGVVGVPDRAGPATTTVDVPVSLPLSARVDAGARWVEGDEVGVAITVRNRTSAALRTSLSFTSSGVARFAPAPVAARPGATAPPRAPASTTGKDVVLDVPAGGSARTTVRMRADVAGQGALHVRARAPGAPEDVVHHTWEVVPAGEKVALAAARWVDGELTIADPGTAAGMRAAGPLRLVLERGHDAALGAALDAIDPDRWLAPTALADAIEVAARIERWATVRGGKPDPTAIRARDVGRRAQGRLAALQGDAPGMWAASARAEAWQPATATQPTPGGKSRKPTKSPDGDCPPDGLTVLDAQLEAIEGEPAPAGGAVDTCWDELAASVTRAATEADAVALARLVLAFAERPHRAPVLSALVENLRRKVSLYPSGGIVLPPARAADRASRALVYAALLRTHGVGSPAAPADRLTAWLLVQRDAFGGYGSAEATRNTVRALLAAAPPPRGDTRVTIEGAGVTRTVTVKPNGLVEVPLGGGAGEEIEIRTEGPGLVARLERPALRPWSRPPARTGPVDLELTWPKAPVAGEVARLAVTVSQHTGRQSTVAVRIPLPAGVALAAPVEGTRQLQGALLLRIPVDGSGAATPLQIPLRFALAGRMTAPEARAELVREQLPETVAPAQPIVVR